MAASRKRVTSVSDAQAAVQDDSRVSSELARFRRGEMSLDELIDHKVERAVAHLQGKVSDAELEIARDTVRAQIAANPTTRALLSRLTEPR